MSLVAELDAAFSQNRNKPCIVSPDGDIASFANFHTVVLSFAERLRALGVREKSKVAVTIPQYELSLAFRLAILRLGAIVFSMREVDRTGESGVEIDKVISDRSRPTHHPREVFVSPEWMARPIAIVPPAQGGGFVHATSGSSGVPKLRFDSESVFRARLASNMELRGRFAGPILNAQNIATLIGQKVAFSALLQGQLQISMGVGVEATLDALIAHRVTEAYIPPSHLRELLRLSEARALTFPDLQKINVGGGAISHGFAEQCEEVFSAALYSDYGSTETDTIATARVVDSPADRTIFNLFYPGTEISLEESDGNLVKVRIPEERRTRALFGEECLFDSDGWLTLDDVGKLNDDGSLEILGRSSDIINAGGNKFSPHILEAFAEDFPGIRDIAAFRLPSDSHIDGIGFAVVLEDDQAVDLLQTHLSNKLDIYHDLQVFPLVEIPKTPGGKPDRIALARAYG